MSLRSAHPLGVARRLGRLRSPATLVKQLPPYLTQRAKSTREGDGSTPDEVPPTLADSATTKSSRVSKYMPRLRDISSRTGTPIPLLVISFLVLHELTATVPLILFFFAFQAIGAGAGVVSWIESLRGTSRAERQTDGSEGEENSKAGWDWREEVGNWYEEGQKRVEKVGKRYGIFGYEKKTKTATEDEGVGDHEGEMSGVTGTKAAESVANAISAYVVVKVCRSTPRFDVLWTDSPRLCYPCVSPCRSVQLQLLLDLL